MKPSPYRVREAVGLLGADHSTCVLVGDSPADVLAGHLAGVAVIGYATKPSKAQALADVQAAAVTIDLAEITTALRTSPVAALPNESVVLIKAAPPQAQVWGGAERSTVISR